MSDVTFTKHAQKRMVERNIPEDMAIALLAQAQPVSKSKQGSIEYWVKDEYMFIVAINKTPKVVITVYRIND